MSVKCIRCGKVFKGNGHGESVDFDYHVCKNMRSLKEMPMDVLRRKANGKNQTREKGE